jgi:hypothetical protein
MLDSSPSTRTCTQPKQQCNFQSDHLTQGTKVIDTTGLQHLMLVGGQQSQGMPAAVSCTLLASHMLLTLLKVC